MICDQRTQKIDRSKIRLSIRNCPNFRLLDKTRVAVIDGCRQRIGAVMVMNDRRKHQRGVNQSNAKEAMIARCCIG